MSKFSWILSDSEGPLSYGGRAYLKRIFPQKGKIISSWYEFNSTFKRKFYMLGYMQQAIMDWDNLRQGKRQSVQEYT